MKNKIYIVQAKETYIDSDSVQNVDCETYGKAFASKKDAQAVMWKMSDDMMNDLLDQGYDAKDISRETNADCDHQCVNCQESTYEYFVTELEVA